MSETTNNGQIYLFESVSNDLSAQNEKDEFRKILEEIDYCRVFWDGQVEEQKREHAFRFQWNKHRQIVKAPNLAGILRGSSEGQRYTIHLLPKLFKSNSPEKQAEIAAAHLFAWLYQAQDLNGFFQPNLGNVNEENDPFKEILLALFTQYTHSVVTESQYQSYTQVNQTLGYLKGRLNMTQYSRLVAQGNAHKLPCNYSSLERDSLFNRIIKRVCTLLLHETENANTKQQLEDILFVFDDITPQAVTPDDCHKVKLNPMYAGWQTVLDYCELFLSGCQTHAWQEELEVFSLLFPMEYLFEKLVYRILAQNTPQGYELKVKPTPEYLAESNGEQLFGLQPDMILYKDSQPFAILDTKYKFLDKSQKNFGIAQSDLYQMVTYAVKWDTSHIILLYPQTWEDNLTENELAIVKKFIIDLKAQKTLNFWIIQVPMIVKEQSDSSQILTQLETRWKVFADQLFKHLA